MNDPAKPERAALDVLALLPDGWHVGRASYPRVLASPSAMVAKKPFFLRCFLSL